MSYAEKVVEIDQHGDYSAVPTVGCLVRFRETGFEFLADDVSEHWDVRGKYAVAGGSGLHCGFVRPENSENR